MAAMQLTRTHRILVGVVVAGAVVIAGIGFAGSYAAVRELAQEKGFGDFSVVFPIGIDAGICVLLALDLLLTWIRIPFPLLRQTAWLLTAATIAFNGATAWPDPLGVGMHAVIPILFVVAVEAARHAVGRIADITADKHMEGVRLTRWLLSPIPTFRLWRRMKLWELRRYDQVIRLEQDRLIYQARLQARYGRAWRRKAPVESLMPLRLAKYGVPLADTAPAGLAAAGIDPQLMPPVVPVTAQAQAQQPALPAQQAPVQPVQQQYQQPQQWQEHQQPQTQPAPQQQPQPQATHESPWFEAQVAQEAYDGNYSPTAYDTESSPTYVPPYGPDDTAQQPAPPMMIPSGAPGRTRPLAGATLPGPRQPEPDQQPELDPQPPLDEIEFMQTAYEAFRAYAHEHNNYPSADQLDIHLADIHQLSHPHSAALVRRLLPEFRHRHEVELKEEHIA
ncbi:DUF2637 domain-containing protein [Streptomyces sp. NPDC050738]|uniref:DUF2637 domain-containing protein n=1 Tax=Streptomyces sp. NPDC050738 TaxID=3154744 RepID=UPI0034179F45